MIIIYIALIGLLLCVVTGIFALTMYKRTKPLALDPLTNLRTRPSMNQAVKDLLEETVTPTAIVLVEVDHLADLNMRYGDTVGDTALKAVASTLKQTTRETDITGRISGTCFCSVMPDTDMPGARLFAQSLKQNIELLEVSGIDPNEALSAHFGIAIHMPGTPFGSSYVAASEALLRAKEEHINKIGISQKRMT